MAAGSGLATVLTAGERDYLVRNSGEQVKISSIEGGTVALYFSDSDCLFCVWWFTPKLIEAYEELASHGKSFEVVFVSHDSDEKAFNAYFAEMPWLAVPYSDSESRQGLEERFEVSGFPHLVILDAKTGEVLTGDGVGIVSEFGMEAYPFTPERISELEEQEKAAKDNQTIHSVLGTPDRDYLISNKRGKAPACTLTGISEEEKEGKTEGNLNPFEQSPSRKTKGKAPLVESEVEEKELEKKLNQKSKVQEKSGPAGRTGAAGRAGGQPSKKTKK